MLNVCIDPFHILPLDLNSVPNILLVKLNIAVRIASHFHSDEVVVAFLLISYISQVVYWYPELSFL